MSNTITAYFKGRVGVAESVYQNDYGIVMAFDSIDLPAHFDCYFSVPGSDTSTPAVGADNMVVIPNAVLGNSGNMSVHIPLHTGSNDSEVEYVAYFKVIGRARPEDDGTPAQMTAIEQALALLQNPIGNIEQIVNEALSFTGDTFAEMKQELQDDFDEYTETLEGDLATWKGGVESDIDDVEADFAVLQGQFDTAVAAVTTDTEVTDIRVGADGVTDTTAGASVRRQFTNLKSDIDSLADLEDIKVKVFNQTVSGTRVTDVNVSIPSGDYKLTIDNVTSSDTDDTTSAVIFYNSSNTSVLTLVLNRNVPISKDITLSADVVKISFLAANGWGGGAGDTFTYSNVCIFYTETTTLQTEVDKKLEVVTQSDLTFAEVVYPENLIDVTDEDMCKPDYWYYNTSVGSIVSAETSQYTVNAYHALRIPIYDAEEVTIGYYPPTPNSKIFWIGAVDADMKLLSYSTVNADMPVTFTIPSGAVYVLASLQLGKNMASDYLPRLMVVNGTTITKYAKYEKPYYLLEDCRAGDSAETIDNIASVIGSEPNSVKLRTPSQYALVVGDTFQLFYKGIIDSSHPEIYEVVAQCSKGTNYERYFEITPTTAETLSLTLTLYGINHNILDTATVSLVVSAKASSPVAQKNVLCVGDSLTTEGIWVKELYRRLTASGGTPSGDELTNINFIGTRSRDGIHYEGYGGWKFSNYNTASVDINAKVITCTHDKTSADQHSIYKDGNNAQWKLETIESNQIKIIAVSGNYGTFPTTGTLTWVSGGVNHNDIVYTASANASGNPFWNSNTNAVDFANYATEQGVSSIDYVYVLLGWNDAATAESAYKANAQTFIDNVQSDFPNAKIVLVGLQIPAKDGLATNYGATGIYSRYYDLMQYVFNLDNWYEDLVDANSNVYHINLSGQFDTEYNMPTMSVAVNTRNSTMVNRQSNGVHPATSGQYQIADAVYRDITARL